MKNLIFYLFILMCFSCKKNDLKQAINEPLLSLNENNQEKKNTEIVLKLPLGEKKIIEYNFPKEWNNLEGIDDTNPDFSIEKISKKGYDSIFYFIEKTIPREATFPKFFIFFAPFVKQCDCDSEFSCKLRDISSLIA